MRSDSGAMIGIMAAACPLPELIKKLTMVWIRNMMTALRPAGRPPRMLDMPYTMVSMMLPCVSTSETAFAMPSTRAAVNISLPYFVNMAAISLGL